MSFEIKLANGKVLKTDSAFEVAMFYQSNGTSIAPAPKRHGKRNRKGKRNPQKVG
jgi:hypothetical protein